MTKHTLDPVEAPEGRGDDSPAAADPGNGGARLLNWPEDRLILVILFLLAWELRIGVAALGGFFQTESGDGEGYYSAAVGLVEGKGIVRILPNGHPHLSAHHMPLTALLLAGGMKVFGTSLSVARMVAITIGSLAGPLMYLIARTIIPRRWAGFAGLACSIHPVFLYCSIQTVSQPFYTPLFLFGVLLAVRAMQRPGFAPAFIDGLVWGLAALCRPQAVPAAILLALGMGLTLRSWRPVLGLSLGVVLVLTPWWARNFVVFGRPVVLNLQGGETFLGSNNPYVLADPELAGTWIAPMGIPEYRDQMIRCDDEIEINETLMRFSTDYLRGHPQVIPRLVLNKWARWLTPITKSGGMNRLMVVSSYGVLLLLVSLGLVFRKIRYGPLLAVTLAITLAEFAIVGIYWGNLAAGRIALEFTWLPWGVQTLQLLVADWYRWRTGRE
jgi:hypothetical protein